jgi:hypothetical protein
VARSHSREPFYFFRASLLWPDYGKDYFVEGSPVESIPLFSLRPFFLPAAFLLWGFTFFCVVYFGRSAFSRKMPFFSTVKTLSLFF